MIYFLSSSYLIYFGPYLHSVQNIGIFLHSCKKQLNKKKDPPKKLKNQYWLELPCTSVTKIARFLNYYINNLPGEFYFLVAKHKVMPHYKKNI